MISLVITSFVKITGESPYGKLYFILQVLLRPGCFTDTVGQPYDCPSASVVNLKNMMTSSIGNIFRVTGPLCGEFTGPGEFPTQRPVTRSFGVFFDLRLNKKLSKQPWGRWFETPSWSLWRQCNDEGRIEPYGITTKHEPSAHLISWGVLWKQSDIHKIASLPVQ